jgi:spermidine synthase
LHQLDDDMIRVVVRTFLEVFPDGQAWLLHLNVDIPVLGLVGRLGPAHYSNQWVEQRPNGFPLEAALKELALGDSLRLFGQLLAGPTQLRAFAARAPLNTDDQPRITFGAPRFTYLKNATLYGRLVALLRLGVPNPGETLGLTVNRDAGEIYDRSRRLFSRVDRGSRRPKDQGD